MQRQYDFNLDFDLPHNWETILELEALKLRNSAARRTVYICSPCREDYAEDIYRNMKAARLYMYYAISHMKISPLAPHAYLPFMLSDQLNHERDLAFMFGKELFSITDSIFVCGNRLTDGMRSEIETAAELSLPITIFNSDLFSKVKGSFGEYAVRLDNSHPPMALNAYELFGSGGFLS